MRQPLDRYKRPDENFVLVASRPQAATWSPTALNRFETILLFSIGDQNPCRFPRSQNRNHRVVLGALKIRVHEIIPAADWRFQYGNIPLLRTVGYPVLVLICDARQQTACHTLVVPVGIEKTDHSFGLLEGLD